MQIANHPIGLSSPVFVIAEIGVNHDGSLRRGLELVELAAACGASAVKLQIFTADSLMNGAARFADYQKQHCTDADPAAMLRRYELRPDQLKQIIAAIEKHDLVPLATPFSLSDVPIIAELNLPAVKIASPDLVNQPLLSAVAKLKRPMLISTGAATLPEVDRTCRWLRQWNATAALLHCVSSYPTPIDQANLCWINELSAASGLPVGYSDHTTEITCGAIAVASGATIVEKHLTYDRGGAGPDHAASADPQDFAEYVRLIRIAEKMRGQPGKRVLEIEQDVRQVSRQSLVADRDLQPGEAVTANDLVTQRPGNGISASDFPAVLGRIVNTNVARGTIMQWDMLEAA